jgi:hypothetical protein
MSADISERIKELCTLFKLPTMATECVRRFRDAGHDAALPVFVETLEAELGERRVRRCDRLLRASHLPPGKTFETLDEKRLPKGVTPRLRELASGDFLERAANVLCFGLPGTGKTHAACALGHALVQHGHAVLLSRPRTATRCPCRVLRRGLNRFCRGAGRRPRSALAAAGLTDRRQLFLHGDDNYFCRVGADGWSATATTGRSWGIG